MELSNLQPAAGSVLDKSITLEDEKGVLFIQQPLRMVKHF